METFIELRSTKTTFGFKSYYVVWKPDNRYKLKKIRLRFKSYYVVWKLKKIDNMMEKSDGLNRTM